MPDGSQVDDLSVIIKTIALVSNAYHIVYGDMKSQKDRFAEGVANMICTILYSIKNRNSEGVDAQLACLNSLYKGKQFWNSTHVTVVD